MKKQLLLCLAAFMMIALAPVNAQETDLALKEKYEQETILLNANNNKYIKNKEKKRIGLFGNRLEQEFANASEETKAEFSTCRKRRKRGVVLMVAGTTAVFVAAVAAPVVTLPVCLGILGTGFITSEVGAIDYTRAGDNLHRAVWLRNRDLLVKK